MKILKYQCVEIPAGKNSEAIIIMPTGEKSRIVSFKKQDCFFEYDERGFETVYKQRMPYSVFRFYPDITGTYVVIINKKRIQIEVEENPNNHGYVEVSKKDSRYFAYTDGQLFMPVGINLAFISPVSKSDNTEFGLSGEYQFLGMRQYERWFRECHRNGVNLVRIWLGHEYFSPDTGEGGVLDLVQLAKIDALVNLAEKYDIRLKLTIEQFRYFDYERIADSDSFNDDVFRKFNKHLFVGEKRCNSVDEWLSEDVWRKMWLYKVGEIAKRLSGNPMVFGIELWNEMNTVQAESYHMVVEWNRRMLKEVKQMFPRHLVMNSLGSYDSEEIDKLYKGFCWEESDVIQMHRYLDQGASYEVCRNVPMEFVYDGIKKLADPQKPFLLAETGAVNDRHSGPFRFYCNDHRGILFCDTVYSALFAGAAGCGHIWHWDDRYLESKNLYSYYMPLVKISEGVLFDEENFASDWYEDDEIILLTLQGKDTVLGYLRNKSDNWKNVLRDLKESNLILNKELSLTVHGALQIEQIWKDETGVIELAENIMRVKNLKYGLLFKITVSG